MLGLEDAHRGFTCWQMFCWFRKKLLLHCWQVPEGSKLAQLGSRVGSRVVVEFRIVIPRVCELVVVELELELLLVLELDVMFIVVVVVEVLVLYA